MSSFSYHDRMLPTVYESQDPDDELDPSRSSEPTVIAYTAYVAGRLPDGRLDRRVHLDVHQPSGQRASALEMQSFKNKFEAATTLVEAAREARTHSDNDSKARRAGEFVQEDAEWHSLVTELLSGEWVATTLGAPDIELASIPLLDWAAGHTEKRLTRDGSMRRYVTRDWFSSKRAASRITMRVQAGERNWPRHETLCGAPFDMDCLPLYTAIAAGLAYQQGGDRGLDSLWGTRNTSAADADDPDCPDGPDHPDDPDEDLYSTWLAEGFQAADPLLRRLVPGMYPPSDAMGLEALGCWRDSGAARFGVPNDAVLCRLEEIDTGLKPDGSLSDRLIALQLEAKDSSSEEEDEDLPSSSDRPSRPPALHKRVAALRLSCSDLGD